MGSTESINKARGFTNGEVSDCASIAPEDAHWQQTRVELKPDTAAEREIGSASLAVEWLEEPGAALRWKSDMGVDAVIVERQDGNRFKAFEPEGFGATHQVDSRQEPSAITFCYDHELSVNQDANPSYERRYEWTLKESAHPKHLRLKGRSQGSSTYRLTVTKGDSVERGFQVRGTITIDNLTPKEAVLEEVVSKTADGIEAYIDCGVEIGGHVLEAGDSLTCDYLAELPDASTRQTHTRVKTRGGVKGATASARVDFSEANVDVLNDTIAVTDSRGHAWTFNQSGTSVYRRIFHCDADAGLQSSMARIVGSDTADSTTVTVDCQPAPEDPTASDQNQPN